MITSRRTLLKQTAALVLAQPALGLGAAALRNRAALAASTLANAVEMVVGNSIKLGSAIIADTTALAMTPISSQRAFFNLNYQLTKGMPGGYQGRFSLIGTSDAIGHNSFAVNILPPNGAIPGSRMLQSLQVLVAQNSSYSSYASMVFPEMIPFDGYPHNLQVAVGVMPGNAPQRFMFSAVDLNLYDMSTRSSFGYYTDPLGAAPLPNQIPPAAFNIPWINTGLAGGDKYALYIGQPVTSRVGGSRPVSGSSNWMDTLPAHITQVYLLMNPVQNISVGATIPKFINVGSPAQTVNAALSRSSLVAMDAEEIIAQQLRAPNSATLTAARKQVTSLSANITAAANNAAVAGASAAVQYNIAMAGAYATQATNWLAVNNPTEAITAVMDAQNSLTTATNGSAGGSTTAATINISGSPVQPQMYLSGNANGTVQAGTGSITNGGDSTSILTNQVNGVTLSGPGWSTFPVQSSGDPYSMTLPDVIVNPYDNSP